MSNASTENFNKKIRWLIRQAYGFRDVFYLKLKIFQFPSIQIQKELWFMAQAGEKATISTNAIKVYFFLQNGATAQNTPTQSSTAAGVV